MSGLTNPLTVIAVDSLDETTFDAVTEEADAILASLTFDGS